MPKTRILVIDDEPMLGFTLTIILEEAHDVVAVQSAMDGQRELREGSFDLVLCDLRMPVMSGMDLFDWVGREHPTMSERFLFMTGGACTERAELFLERADVHFIEKPFEGARVLERVAERIARAAPRPPGVADSIA